MPGVGWGRREVAVSLVGSPVPRRATEEATDLGTVLLADVEGGETGNVSRRSSRFL